MLLNPLDVTVMWPWPSAERYDAGTFWECVSVLHYLKPFPSFKAIVHYPDIGVSFF